MFCMVNQMLSIEKHSFAKIQIASVIKVLLSNSIVFNTKEPLFYRDRVFALVNIVSIDKTMNFN